MSVSFDTTSMKAMHLSLKADLKRILPMMISEGNMAAEEERITHAYNNRTYRLQTSTMALVPQRGEGPGEYVVEVVMDMPYADYIVNVKGLSNFNEICEAAGERIGERLRSANY